MKFNNTLTKLAGAVALSALAATSFAVENEKEAADMSDPMAIYTMGGVSYGTNGINLKMMKTLDTGSATDLSALIVEVKDMDFVNDGEERHGKMRSASPSNLRIRKFDVNMTNGLGLSYDIMQNLDGRKPGVAMVGAMQALPQIGFWQAFPILGAGLMYGEADNGINMDGVLLNFTMYNKFTVTDKIWLNWNIVYNEGIYGSEDFKNSMNSASDSMSHEFIASYQINPRNNLRLWYNVSHDYITNDKTGETRLEYNRQF